MLQIYIHTVKQQKNIETGNVIICSNEDFQEATKDKEQQWLSWFITGKKKKVSWFMITCPTIL